MSLSSHSQAGQMAGSLVMPGLSQGSAFHELLPADLKEIIVHVRLSVSKSVQDAQEPMDNKGYVILFFLAKKRKEKEEKTFREVCWQCVL